MKFTTVAASTAIFAVSVWASARCDFIPEDAVQGIDCMAEAGMSAETIEPTIMLYEPNNTVECWTNKVDDYWFGIITPAGPCFVNEGVLIDGDACRFKNNMTKC